MLFDLKCKDGSVWKWGTNSSSVYRPDGTKAYPKQRASSPLEISKEDFRYTEFPRHVEIILGEKCNLDCEYCYQSKLRREGVGWSYGPKDIDGFMNLLEFAFPQVGEFSFWGGEPLVYWKTLEPLGDRIREAYPLSRLGMVTNGTLINEDVIAWALGNRVHVMVSCDGPGDDRDHEAQDENWGNLADAEHLLGDLFSWKVTRSKGNFDCDYIRRYFAGWGSTAKVDTRNIIRLVPEHELATKMTEQDCKEAEDGAYWDTVHGYIDPGKVIRAIVTRQSPWEFYGECSAGIGGQVAVNLNGDMFICHENFGRGTSIGNLRDMPGVKVQGCHSPYERKRCRECPVVIACGGACPRLPLDAPMVCAGRKAHATGVLKAAFWFLFGIEVEEITPHVE